MNYTSALDDDEDGNKKFFKDLILTLHKWNEHPNSELEEWFKCMKNNVKRSTTDPLSPLTENGVVVPGMQLFLLLRECLLNHRWSEATVVLSALIQTPSACRHIIHKAGTEIMYNASPENHDLLGQFIDQVKRLRFVVSVDVVLEYALYLLMIGQTESACKAIKDLPVKLGGLYKQKISAHEEYAHKKYIGYVGLTRYYEFRLIKARVEQRHTHEEDAESSAASDSEYALMKMKALEAIDYLKTFINAEVAGSYWDCFITALVEVLEFQERDHEALQALQWYAAHNPDNANTFRYLVLYYQRHADPDQELVFMQQFCDAVPSDEMVLVLYERLMAKGCPTSQTLHLLFDLLDYGDWASQPKPWSLLATQLEGITKHGSADDDACIQECWSIRESWWPAFHLTTRGTQDPNLLVHKARVGVILTGHDCAFATEVLNSEFELKELKYLRRSIRRLCKTNPNIAKQS